MKLKTFNMADTEQRPTRTPRTTTAPAPEKAQVEGQVQERLTTNSYDTKRN